MRARTIFKLFLGAAFFTAICLWLMPLNAGERHRRGGDDPDRRERAEHEEHFKHMLELVREHAPDLFDKLMKLRREHPDAFRREVIEAGERILERLEAGERERRHDEERDSPRPDDRRRPRHDRPRDDAPERPRHDKPDPDRERPPLRDIERRAREIMNEIREIDPEAFEKLLRIKKENPEEFLRVLRDIWTDLHHEEREREEHDEDGPPNEEIMEQVEDILSNEEELAEIRREAPEIFELLMAIKKHGPKPELLEKLRDIYMEREREEAEAEEGELQEVIKNQERILHALKKRHPEIFEKLMEIRKHEPDEFPLALLRAWRRLNEERKRGHDDKSVSPEDRERIDVSGRHQHMSAPISPEEEEKILGFIKENNPGWFRELMEVRRRNPDAYRDALREAAGEARELAGLMEKDPEAAKDIRDNNRLTHRQWELVEKCRNAKSDEERNAIRDELRGVLDKLFDVRLRKWLRRIKELEREINELKKEEEEYRKNKKEIIEEKLKELIGENKRRFPGG